jgi:hypothetical protein
MVLVKVKEELFGVAVTPVTRKKGSQLPVQSVYIRIPFAG